MALRRENNLPLKDFSTFRLGGQASEMVTVENEADLSELFETMPEARKWFILGSGSNIIFPDSDIDVCIIRLARQEIKILKDEGEIVELSISAGTIWDDVVSFAVDRGLSGIEALSAIPGTSGATPVQNVGAYGREISHVLISLKAFDTQFCKVVELSNKECEFAYRDSIFKNAGKGRYIIIDITLRLSHDEPDVPQYPGLAEYFAERDIRRPSLQDIRDAIISIRAKKLPDPSVIASVGSFFKNAFVPIEQAQKLKEEYPTLAIFPVDGKTSKVGTGSLIDTLGFKGKRFGNLSLYHGNAMVVVNEGGATRRELNEFIEMIKLEVHKKFGIAIEPEPELLNF